MDEPNESQPVRQRYIVSGRVQGVGFRAWTARRARGLGLRGTVRNRADGTVDIEVAGQEKDVRRMREILSRGPDLAVVRDVRREPPSAMPLPEGFRIIG